MKSRGLEIVVGMFVCLGIAAVFILTLRVSNLAGATTGPGYEVTAQFSNIGGLRSGAQVSLAGVRIGRVSNIAVDQNTYDAVVSMNIEDDYKIPKDSDASILTAGLLGEQYIGLTPGAAAKFLQEGDEIKITQSAVILEKLIGQLLYAFTSGKNDDDTGGDDFGGGFGGSNSLDNAAPAGENQGQKQPLPQSSAPADSQTSSDASNDTSGNTDTNTANKDLPNEATGDNN